MADVLKVSPEALVNTAVQFKNYQKELENAYLTMSDAVRSLDTTWDGEASEAFKAQFESMYKNLSQTEQKMTDAYEELLKAHDLFEEYENKVKGQASALEVGTSPFA